MIYRRIKDLRNDKDWTQQYVSELLFMSRSTYAAYENGANSMTPEILIKLAQLYGTSVDYLLEQTDNPVPYTRPLRK